MKVFHENSFNDISLQFAQERFEGLNKHLNKYESEGITEMKYG